MPDRLCGLAQICPLRGATAQAEGRAQGVQLPEDLADLGAGDGLGLLPHKVDKGRDVEEAGEQGVAEARVGRGVRERYEVIVVLDQVPPGQVGIEH